MRIHDNSLSSQRYLELYRSVARMNNERQGQRPTSHHRKGKEGGREKAKEEERGEGVWSRNGGGRLTGFWGPITAEAPGPRPPPCVVDYC